MRRFHFFSCAAVVSLSILTIGVTASTNVWAPRIPGLLERIQQPLYDDGSVYVTPTFGGGQLCFFQTPLDGVSLGSPDALNASQRSTCGDQLFFGGTVGVKVGSTPNPMVSGAGADQSLNRIIFGFETTFLGGTGSATLQGTPVIALGGLPNTDTYKATDNFIFMADATATFPVTQSFAVVGRAGFAEVDKTVQYNCNGYCAVAGVPSFSQSQSVWLPGVVIGGGFVYAPPGSPVALQVDVDQIFTGNKTVEFGQPATVFTASKVSQSDTLVMGGIRMYLDGFFKREVH